MSGLLTPSQTVGPFFGVGLPFENGEQLAPPGSAGVMRIEGQVLDGKGEPVPDALLEIWQPGAGFGRARTDSEGAFHFITAKPGAIPAPDGKMQAPHLNVTVFARGLLRHLVTRIYFPDEAEANAAKWNYLDYAEALKTRPVLILEAHDRNLSYNKDMKAALQRAGSTRVTEIYMDTDHSFSDHRIALQAAVLEWLQTALPPTTK